MFYIIQDQNNSSVSERLRKISIRFNNLNMYKIHQLQSYSNRNIIEFKALLYNPVFIGEIEFKINEETNIFVVYLSKQNLRSVNGKNCVKKK